MNRRAFVFAGALSMAGAAAAQPLPEVPPAELEPVHEIHMGSHGLTIRVTSHGCTAKPDFAWYVERQGRAVTVAFARRRLDRCRGATGTVDLAFAYDELGLARGERPTVLNPVR